jgi:hypothetical protein
MPSGIPVECYPLAASSFPANCAVESIQKAGLFVSGVDVKLVGPVIRALLDAGKTPQVIAAALIAAGFIAQGASVAEVALAISEGLAEAASEKWLNYSCCKDSTTGQWYLYNPTTGWDTSKPC